MLPSKVIPKLRKSEIFVSNYWVTYRIRSNPRDTLLWQLFILYNFSFGGKSMFALF